MRIITNCFSAVAGPDGNFLFILSSVRKMKYESFDFEKCSFKIMAFKL